METLYIKRDLRRMEISLKVEMKRIKVVVG